MAAAMRRVRARVLFVIVHSAEMFSVTVIRCKTQHCVIRFLDEEHNKLKNSDVSAR